MSLLLNHQFACHIVVVRPTDHAARHRVFTPGGRLEGNGRSLPGLDWSLDPQLRYVQTVLNVGGGDLKLDGFSGLDSDDGGFDRILLHCDLDMLISRGFFLAP